MTEETSGRNVERLSERNQGHDPNIDLRALDSMDAALVEVSELRRFLADPATLANPAHVRARSSLIEIGRAA